MNTTAGAQSSRRQTQWESASIDLEAYLARIGYRGSIRPDLETLRSLQQAHLDAIPFENLDVITGDRVQLDLGSIQDKLVHRRRGGYCHEQNILFASVLDRLGFHVTGRSARMLMGDDEQTPSALGHTCLAVRIDGVDWHVDVGVGHIGPREPIPLHRGVEVRHDQWAYRMDRTREGRWLLRHYQHDGWFNVYQFSEEPFYREDYRYHNYIASTHPESPFVRRIVAQYNGGNIRYALTDCELKVFRPGEPPEQRNVQPSDLPAVLRDVFDLSLASDSMDLLVERARSQCNGEPA